MDTFDTLELFRNYLEIKFFPAPGVARGYAGHGRPEPRSPRASVEGGMLRVETVNYGRSLIFFCNKTILLKRLAVPAEALAKAGVS